MNTTKLILVGVLSFLSAHGLFATEFNVTNYGAVGNGVHDDTDAIQAAVDACSTSGTVTIPPGNYMTREVQLKSNMTLDIQAGARVVAYTGTMVIGNAFHRHAEAFGPNHDIKHPGGVHAIFFAEGTSTVDANGQNIPDVPVINVTVQGKGIIDGISLDPYYVTPVGNPQTPEMRSPPRALRFRFCNNVTVRDVTLKNTDTWVQSYDRCNGVIIDGVVVDSLQTTPSDGLDVLNCSDVVIQNCFIDSDDDSISIKSSGDPRFPGEIATAMTGIIIQNNSLHSSRNNAITFGLDTAGALTNYTIRNNFIRFAGKGAICVNSADGADVSDVLIDNNFVEDCGVPLFMRLNNRDREGFGVGSMENVLVQNLQARYCRNLFGSSLTAIPGYYIENVVLRNFNIIMRAGSTTTFPEPGEYEDGDPKTNIFGNLPSYAFYLRHINNFTLEDINVSTRADDVRDWLVTSDATNLKTINCTDYRGKPLPVFSLVRKDLQSGDAVYSDGSTDKFASVPANIAGGDWIRTKKASSAFPLNFLVGYPSNVFVAVDNSSSVPTWLSETLGWMDSGQDLTLSDGQTYGIYQKAFGAGALVSLGYSNTTNVVNYLVIVKTLTPPRIISGEVAPDWPALIGGVDLPTASLMSGTEVTVEAEHTYMRTSAINGKEWATVTIADATVSGGTNNNAIQALPNTGGASVSAPGPAACRADYPIKVPTAGNYYVHFRARGDTGDDADNSVFLTVNNAITPYQGITTPPISLSWVNATNPIALPAGLSTINVWMREDGQVLDKIDVNTSATRLTGIGPAESPQSTPDVAWQMSDNQVVMEAENAYSRLAGVNRGWQNVTINAGSGGTARNAIQALPNCGGTALKGPAYTADLASCRVDYPINVPTAGNYYVFVYGRGDTGNDADNSIFVSVNGETTEFQTITTAATSLNWAKAANPVALPAGVSTVTLWMREDGQVIDKIVVKDTATNPTGTGPAESPRN